jgi:nucleotide-binding universal stress UspA family protein
MSIKDVLVVLEAGERGDSVAAYAASFAEQMGAHLTATGLALELVPPASFMGDYPYDLMAQATEQARAAVGAAYKKLADALPTSVQSELVTIQALPGQAREQFGRLARHFDISIVAQAQPEATDDELMAEAALFRSGRPVLLVPHIHKGPAKFGKALVAWDGGLTAARAIGDALPVLKRAGRVEVVSVASNRLPPEELPGFNITRHLVRHGINAEVRKLPDGEDIGSIILSYAADCGADFLVMGGYGHSRWREFMLGGATRSILQSMTVPVLMSH